MKYIIDIPDNSDTEYTYDQDTKELKFPSPRIDPTSFMGLEIVLTNVIPYTEPDRKAIDLQHAHDIENVARMNYSKGAEEAWEFAKEVRLEEFIDEEGRLHGYISGFNSYSEAKAKYEAWKKQKDEIRVGDEVIPFDTQYDKMVVTNLWTSEYYDEWVDAIAGDGKIHRFLKASVKKTGRHFDEVEELLKKMGDEK